ncbi:PAS domain-containing protein [Marinobacter orientalis]|uniref:histidine kinase n=1 Tax=Marinobacter orientalis TaxID=1928859 RepID=A0A7Y0R9A1_9GAMM|nr:PAS domain-containing protein [Marinobacter orientalis]NMT62310.1 PAS domain-containing protein [Marinobacter orientalis]TGX51017.1 PAS domain S-box protein [Marinobacter orientalis]
MLDIAVVGDSATEQWLTRQDKKFRSEGLRCHFIHCRQGLDDLPEPDLWLGDLDALAPNELESLGQPLVVMAKAFSLELAQSAVSSGAARCFGKPVTPRALSECCRDLGIGSPPCSCTLAVLEDRETAFEKIDGVLAACGMAGERLTSVRDGITALRQHPPDGLVLGHYPETLSVRYVIDLLRSFPELSRVPVFIMERETGEDELLHALSALVDIVYVASPGELANAVSLRLNRAQASVRHRLYERFHGYEQERRALNLHAIVSKTDRAGRIIEVNDRFCEISGYSVNELIGENHRILKSGVHSPEFYRNLWSTISQGEVWRGEICNQARDGSHYWVSSTIVPYLDQSGRPYQYIAIRKDITHVKGAEAMISRQGELASRLGEAGALLLDVGWQDAALGLRSALAPLCDLLMTESIVLDLHQEYPFLKYGTRASLAAEDLPNLWVRTAGASSSDSRPSLMPPAEAALMANDVQVGTVGLHGSSNAMVETFSKQGLMRLLANILVAALTRWQREYEHEQSRERLRVGQKYSGIGTWEWNLATGELYWTEQIPVLFGYREGALQTSYENFLAAVHPEDREPVETAIQRTVEEDQPYRIEHRVVWPDGQIRWLLETGDITRDEDGKPIQMLGVVQDVTEIREADLKLERQSSLLNVLHDSLNAFVLEGGFKATLDTMLDHLLRLTGSEFGYLAEVLYDHDEMPYLRVQAITDISWDVFSSEMVSRVGTDRFEFRELDNMLGACIREGRPVVVDQASAGVSFSRLPPGHPEIRTFLNVPIFVGPELVGTFALANRKEGYDDALIEFLRPFMATYGVIIKSQRMLDMEASNQKNLIRAKQRADLANRAKSEFLSSMSHELRTPLNAILGFGQLLEIDADLNEEQQDNVQEILNASRHLLTLINEVLDLAKIESGKLDLSLESIPVTELLEETLTLVRHMAESRGISLRTEDTNGFRVAADWTRLKQAVLNLISNAIKYNRVQGDVLISARQHGENWVDIRVSDTGPGIEPSRLAELFQPFNRLGAELSNIEGTGIGLALTQRMVDLMGGSVGVESHVGEGSTFWLRLPAEDGGNAIDTSGAPVVQPQSQPAQTDDDLAEETRTVLYIEDNPANLKLVARILQRYPGARLLTTASGTEGVTMAKVAQPDLVLLDINLPDMDGYQILRALKACSETADIPVIALTANAMHNEVRRGKQAGFDDYLTKPISVDELLATLETYLR